MTRRNYIVYITNGHIEFAGKLCDYNRYYGLSTIRPVPLVAIAKNGMMWEYFSNKADMSAFVEEFYNEQASPSRKSVELLAASALAIAAMA